MEFNQKGDVTPLCSKGESNSLFVWSKEALTKLANEEENQKKITRRSDISVGAVI